ncbi:hypothetical protein C8Q80DRAFT_518431 [Daedaleopsis nitida]|nr:hypothetical protein C8Q80DRAFT_518431 [Daedaleopsis nitida]
MSSPTESYSASQRRILRTITDNAQNRGFVLDHRWSNLSRTLVQMTAWTTSLGFFTTLVLAAAYLAISKRHTKDNLTMFAIVSIIMAWMSHMAFTTVAVSRAIQDFTVVASDITELRAHVEQAVQYVATLDNRAFFRNGPVNPFIAKPAYTMHKCVGTTALVANALVEHAAFSYFSWLLAKKRKLVLVPLGLLSLATFRAAFAHMAEKCAPERDVATLSNIRLVQKWSVTDVVSLDATTALLNQLTRKFALGPAVYWIWTNGGAINAHFRHPPGGGARRVLLRTLGLVFGLPVCVVLVLSALAESYRGVQSKSILGYALLSAYDSIVPTLLGMYPSIVHITSFVGAARADDADSPPSEKSLVDEADSRIVQELTMQSCSRAEETRISGNADTDVANTDVSEDE